MSLRLLSACTLSLCLCLCLCLLLAPGLQQAAAAASRLTRSHVGKLQHRNPYRIHAHHFLTLSSANATSHDDAHYDAAQYCSDVLASKTAADSLCYVAGGASNATLGGNYTAHYYPHLYSASDSVCYQASFTLCGACTPYLTATGCSAADDGSAVPVTALTSGCPSSYNLTAAELISTPSTAQIAALVCGSATSAPTSSPAPTSAPTSAATIQPVTVTPAPALVATTLAPNAPVPDSPLRFHQSLVALPRQTYFGGVTLALPSGALAVVGGAAYSDASTATVPTIYSDRTWVSMDGGATWNSSITNIPARYGAAVSTDPSTGRFLVHGGVAPVSSYTTAAAKSLRVKHHNSRHAVAFVSSSSGGSNQQLLGDTWSSADGVTWQLESNGTDPNSPQRYDACVVAYQQSLVSFFGLDPVTQVVTNDVLVSNNQGRQWAVQPSADSVPSTQLPPARTKHGCVVNETAQVVIIAGGLSANGSYLSDTWKYNLTSRNWTQQSTGLFPGRAQFSMLYALSTILMIGGQGAAANSTVGGSNSSGQAALLNDIFGSGDEGQTWVQLAAEAPWSPRSMPTVAALNGSLYVMEGVGPGNKMLKDVWVAALADYQVSSGLSAAQVAGVVAGVIVGTTVGAAVAAVVATTAAVAGAVTGSVSGAAAGTASGAGAGSGSASSSSVSSKSGGASHGLWGKIQQLVQSSVKLYAKQKTIIDSIKHAKDGAQLAQKFYELITTKSIIMLVESTPLHVGDVIQVHLGVDQATGAGTVMALVTAFKEPCKVLKFSWRNFDVLQHLRITNQVLTFLLATTLGPVGDLVKAHMRALKLLAAVVSNVTTYDKFVGARKKIDKVRANRKVPPPPKDWVEVNIALYVEPQPAAKPDVAVIVDANGDERKAVAAPSIVAAAANVIEPPLVTVTISKTKIATKKGNTVSDLLDTISAALGAVLAISIANLQMLLPGTTAAHKQSVGSAKAKLLTVKKLKAGVDLCKQWLGIKQPAKKPAAAKPSAPAAAVTVEPDYVAFETQVAPDGKVACTLTALSANTRRRELKKQLRSVAAAGQSKASSKWMLTQLIDSTIQFLVGSAGLGLSESAGAAGGEDALALAATLHKGVVAGQARQAQVTNAQAQYKAVIDTKADLLQAKKTAAQKVAALTNRHKPAAAAVPSSTAAVTAAAADAVANNAPVATVAGTSPAVPHTVVLVTTAPVATAPVHPMEAKQLPVELNARRASKHIIEIREQAVAG